MNRYLKKLNLPDADSVLAYTGLQRSPSTFSTVMSGLGLVGLGMLAGAGLNIWLSSPKRRKEITNAVTNGVDKINHLVQDGVADGKQALQNAIS